MIKLNFFKTGPTVSPTLIAGSRAVPFKPFRDIYTRIDRTVRRLPIAPLSVFAGFVFLWKTIEEIRQRRAAPHPDAIRLVWPGQGEFQVCFDDQKKTIEIRLKNDPAPRFTIFKKEVGEGKPTEYYILWGSLQERPAYLPGPYPTTLDGERLEPGTWYRLRDGSFITSGNVEFVFHPPTPAAAEGPPVRALIAERSPPALFAPEDVERQRLVVKQMEELLRNPRIVTRYPDGRMSASVKGKAGLSLQDLLDFYQLIFHQAVQFREYLRFLQEQGADIRRLAAHVTAIDGMLNTARNEILTDRKMQAHICLSFVDDRVRAFQQGIIEVATSVGCELDPQTGQLRLLDGHLPAPNQAVLGGGRQPVGPLPAPNEVVPQTPSPPQVKPTSGPRQDYIVFIGQRDWIIDFEQHERFYLFHGEKHPHIADDKGYVITSDRSSIHESRWNLFRKSGAKLLGTFSRAPEGCLFRPADRSSPILIQEDVHLAVEGVELYGRPAPARVRTVAGSLISLIRERLSAENAASLNEGLSSILMQLQEREKALKEQELHDVRVQEYRWTMMGFPLSRESFFDNVIGEVSKEDATALVREVVPFFGNPGQALRERARHLLLALMPKLSHKAQLDAVSRIVDIYFDALSARENAPRERNHSFLETILDRLGTDARLKALRLIVDRVGSGEEILQKDLNLLESLAGTLPPELLETVIKPDDSKAFQLFIHAYRGGLPMVKPIYDRYLQSKNPERFLGLAVERIRYFREGGRLFSKDPDHLAFAYGSLDNPEQLSYEEFVNLMTLDDLPAPFMNERFTVNVPLIRVAHAKIDKGILKEAYEMIAQVHTPEALTDYLQKVLSEPKKNGLAPFRGDLEALPREISSENVLEIAKTLLSVLAASRSKLKNQATAVLTHLAIGLASASETGQRLIPMIATYGDKISSEQLIEVLNALREFYAEAIEEIAEPYGGMKLPIIDTTRDRLKKQADRIQTEETAMQSIEMVPSKSQTDACAGYIGEDCTKRHWKEEIRRPDTQVYRMLLQRYVGVVYLKRDILDGKVVLVIGIEPKGRFRVSHRNLLKGILIGLAQLAGKGDYDYILISTSSHQRSNRPDMNDAIDKMFAGVEPITFTQEVSGKIFPGRTFHVAWQRPSGLPKGPPPPEEASRVASHVAATVMGPNR